jgi:hypothetical protein
MPHRSQLTIQEKLAAQYLACGMLPREVQQATEMGESTLKRLQTEPLFIREVDMARQRAFPLLAERLTKRLEELQEPALEKMNALMEAESEPVQFQAAKHLLVSGPLGAKPERGGDPAHGATIHLDQQALAAVLGGALNMGHSGLIAAFAALRLPDAAPMPPPMPQEQEEQDHDDTPSLH